MFWSNHTSQYSVDRRSWLEKLSSIADQSYLTNHTWPNINLYLSVKPGTVGGLGLLRSRRAKLGSYRCTGWLWILQGGPVLWFESWVFVTHYSSVEQFLGVRAVWTGCCALIPFLGENSPYLVRGRDLFCHWQVDILNIIDHSIYPQNWCGPGEGCLFLRELIVCLEVNSHGQGELFNNMAKVSFLISHGQPNFENFQSPRWAFKVQSTLHGSYIEPWTTYALRRLAFQFFSNYIAKWSF